MLLISFVIPERSENHRAPKSGKYGGCRIGSYFNFTRAFAVACDMFGRALSVSYTHLDVYKRQAN